MQVCDLLTGISYQKGELIPGKHLLTELQQSDHMWYLNNIYFKIKAALVYIWSIFKSLLLCTLVLEF